MMGQNGQQIHQLLFGQMGQSIATGVQLRTYMTAQFGHVSVPSVYLLFITLMGQVRFCPICRRNTYRPSTASSIS